MVSDKVCLDARLFRVCALGVEFNAIVKGGNKQLPGSLNILGIGPLTKSAGPRFIEALADQGLIDNAIAVINMKKSKKNKQSTLTLGGIPPQLEKDVKGDWYHHSYKMQKVKPYTEPTALLDLTKVRYGNHTLYQKEYNNVMLSTTETALIKFGDATADIYNSIVENIKKEIDDLTCDTKDG